MFKEGQKVLALYYKGSNLINRSIEKIEKITPAGNFKVSNGNLYTPEGKLKGADCWSNGYIKAISEEEIVELKKEVLYRSKLTSISHMHTNYNFQKIIKDKKYTDAIDLLYNLISDVK